MKSVVMFVLLFACLFALAQWAQNLDLSCFWGEPADAAPQSSQTVQPVSAEEAELLDWFDTLGDPAAANQSRPAEADGERAVTR